ncbi:hypothetical protein [Legionella shakespearei]|uniref:Protein IcmC (DotV)-like protein n=1 Tax=Legionella shakespearei DSM 23087 TaxID=1122169 RepID=A0A0W0ZFP0_9GAMM|nr:hypothetical protein [Legionella shakespearei]KTD67523.1 protein IcmC (DotV)-like protein [Legionella shakespearei DSM 23087]
MNSIDFITILGNISQSLAPMQKLITGGAYLLGVLFFLSAIGKLRKIADHRAQSSSQEKMFTPMIHILFGAMLIYLPTALDTMANTAFGAGNVLTYAPPSPTNIYSVIGVFIRTAGVIWFVRGSVLVVHASQPGTQEGPKGLLFIIAGILAMNFDNTIAMVNYILNALIHWTLAVKASQGF